MNRGRPPTVPLHGHPTAERAVAATIGSGEGNTTTTIAKHLGWPKKAVENALYRLHRARKAWSNGSGLWHTHPEPD